jgi:hypothetical protein
MPTKSQPTIASSVPIRDANEAARRINTMILALWGQGREVMVVGERATFYFQGAGGQRDDDDIEITFSPSRPTTINKGQFCSPIGLTKAIRLIDSLSRGAKSFVCSDEFDEPLAITIQ